MTVRNKFLLMVGLSVWCWLAMITVIGSALHIHN